MATSHEHTLNETRPAINMSLPIDLESLFISYADAPETLIEAFMPIFCDHIKADRIFIQVRNPDKRICKVLRWRRSMEIPWPNIPGSKEGWFIEEDLEDKDPLWKAALQLKPSIYIEDLQKSADEGLLNIDFEKKYMFHTAFIHGHALWPPLPIAEERADGHAEVEERKFYGSVQPAVFDGPRAWSTDVRDLVERCLVKIAPVMRMLSMDAPDLRNGGRYPKQ